MMMGSDLGRKPGQTPQAGDNQVVCSNRQDYLLRYLACSIAPVIGPVGHASGNVFVLCFDAATEFLLTHELQVMGKSSPLRAGSICVQQGSPLSAARVQLHHQLHACNVLVGSLDHVLHLLESPDGPVLSFDMFDVLAIWDAQLVVGNDSYASFAKKFVREEADNPPRVLSFITGYLDATEIVATVELVKSQTLCHGSLVYLTEPAEEGSGRLDHVVELTEEQKDLYDRIKEHMQQYEAQLQEISSHAGTDLFAPYAMGTQEYGEWLDGIQLLCYREAEGNPSAGRECDSAVALVERLKQYNTSLKMVEETSCLHTIQLLTAARQAEVGGPALVPGSAEADLARFSMLHSDSRPWGGEEMFPQPPDFDPFKSALPDAPKDPSQGGLDLQWALELVGKADSSLTPKAAALLKRVQALYKDAMQGRKVQVLVICHCKSSLDYVLDKIRTLNIHCVQGYYLLDLPDMAVEAEGGRTDRRSLRSQMERSMKAKMFPIVVTTRFTTAAIPHMRDWEWTEVLHYDADIYSVVSNKLSDGWAPQIEHHYYMTENSEGAYQYNCQKDNLLRLEERLPLLDKVPIVWSIRDWFSTALQCTVGEVPPGVLSAALASSIKPCYSVPVLPPHLPGSSPALTSAAPASASAPDLMLHAQSRSSTLSSLPDHPQGLSAPFVRPPFDSMVRIDSTGEFGRPDHGVLKAPKYYGDDKFGAQPARAAQLQGCFDQLRQQLSPHQAEVLQQVQSLLGFSQPATSPPAAAPRPPGLLSLSLSVPDSLDTPSRPDALNAAGFDPTLYGTPPPVLQYDPVGLPLGTQLVPLASPISPPSFPPPDRHPSNPALPPAPLPAQRPFQPQMLPMQYRGKYPAEDPALVVMAKGPASYPGAPGPAPALAAPALGKGYGPPGPPLGGGKGKGAPAPNVNPRKHAKTFNQKVDRAQQQLLQAGEAEKLGKRGPPPPPWPLAVLAEPRPWSEDDAKQIWNHNHQKMFPKTPPTYYFGERHHDGNVLFTAETEVFCRVPTDPVDTEGEPIHLHGYGEAPTKKEAQKRAAIAVLKQLQRAGILHVPLHYSEGSKDADKKSESPVESVPELAPQNTLQQLVGDACQQLWGSRPVVTDVSRDNGRPAGQEFQCCLWADGCPLQPPGVLGVGPSRRLAEYDAHEKLLRAIQAAYPGVVEQHCTP